MAEEDNQSLHNENNENNRARTLRDHMNPTRTSAPSCIVFPPDASHFNFKPGIIQLLPSFHGLELENPYLHLREFEEVCNTYNNLNCSMNTIRLKLFPFSLKDKAKTWLQNLRPGSIRAWDEMQQQFLKKFFPSHRTNSFKRQITTFTQKPGETFYKCWDRYRDLLSTCPHHGFETWRLVSHFYEGLTPKDRQMVELMCNGTFEDKDPDEAMEYLDLLAENAQNWDTAGTYEAPSKTQPHTSSGGMYNLREDHDLQAKFASLARKVEALELKKSGQLKSVENIVCQICETNEHSTNDCPTLPSFKECLHEQAHALNSFQRANHNPYSQTYNPGWRNHPNFSWKSENNNAQTSQPPFQAHHNFQNSHGYAPPYAPPPRRNLEETLHAFIEKQETINTQLAQNMTDFKDTLAKLTSALSFQEKGKFPSQPQQNPKGQYNANASSSGSQHMDQVKSVTTLRSGKVIEKPSLEPYEKDDESISEGKEGDESENCKETTDSPPALPFPQAMTKQRKVNHNSEIYEIFKQVRINIPLLDAIKQVPSYAKFLKDLCTVKRKLNVKKKAFLAEQVSAILQNNNALKYKDPGCPTISCFIGEHKIERALLDLGASVNLLPYSVFQSLNLGELKPTSISLLLADRSVKVPRGIIEDVLVQVDKFIYPVDFIVLDTQPVEGCKSFPVILGRPFLATSNALIDCRNGLMKLSFGNMTLEMNIFNICKQPGDDNDLQEVDHIDELVYDQLESTLSKNELDETEDLQMVYSEEEITDETSTKNVDANLLSTVTTDSTSDITPIDDYFPNESLLSLSPMPWYDKNINFLTLGDLPADWRTQDKEKFLNEVKSFYCDDPNLFKYCPDQIFQRFIPDNEVSSVIKLCHSEACGSYFSSKKTTAKIFQNGFYWPTMFKDTHAFCKTCENCQKIDTGQKVLFYDSQLYAFPKELRLRWTNPYGACDIENSMNDNDFKENGHRLKAYFDNFPSENESAGLNDLVDKG
nr:hypothetical protein [Pseudomonas protegens]